jgi:hypothetical protein
MFDKPQYLTGDDGFAVAGQKFYLHAAKLDGTVTIGNTSREQVKLRVSNTATDEPVVVFTAGAGIVGQVKRMTQEDLAAMPIEVRLDQVPSKHSSPTYVLTPASQPEPTTAAEGDPIPF